MTSSNGGAIPKTGLRNKPPVDYKKMNDSAASESSEDHVYQQDIVEVGGTFDTSQCDSGRRSSTALKVLAGTSYSLSRILSQAHAYAIYYDTKYLSIIFTIFIY